MQDLTTTSVTGAVLEQMAGTPDPRLREVMASLVRHLHDFARQTRLTPAEWLRAIGFLTEVGQACSPARQEFILLSDVLGLSALVNLMHDETAGAGAATETSLLGPFSRQSAPEFAAGDSIAVRAGGPEMQVYGRVTGADGAGLVGASVEVWQTDADGQYDLQIDGGAIQDMRGRFHTDADGRFHFRTLRPVGYLIPTDGPVGALVSAQARHGMRPAHIHFLIGAAGHREVVTALYLAEDAHIDSDTVFGVSRSLVVSARADAAAPIAGLPAIRHDFRLAPEGRDGGGRVGADPAQLVGSR